MKNWIAIFILTLLIFVPLQFVEYYDAGTFAQGVPIPWDYASLESDPSGVGDVWVESTDYRVMLINFIPVFIVASVAWSIFRLGHLSGARNRK